MRGVVEIWRGDEKILEGPNMLVDGAGALLADIMTVSPSLSGVEDQATSSILDASNYMIQAMSFGTASEAFQKSSRDLFDHPYLKLERMEQVVRTIQRTGLRETGAFRTIPKFIDPDNPSVYPLSGIVNDLFVDSLDPSIPVLATNTNVSATVPIDGVDIAISSIFPGNGQHVNFMPSAIRNAVTSSTVFSTSAEIVGALMGSFPGGDGDPGGAVYFTSPFDGQVGIGHLSSGSFPNSVSSMDVSGFLTTAMSSVPDGAKYPMVDIASGLCLSAPIEQTNQGFPFVEYSTMLSKDDVHSLNWFGGIFSLGLWTIDIKQSLLNGNTAPFAFSVLDNPRKYKLFCRKISSKDLTYIDKFIHYQDLTIKWRIHFR